MAQFGWKKERKAGQTNITRKIYVELACGPNGQPNLSDPTQYYIADVADIPGSQFNLHIKRDCSTGVPTFLLNGTNMAISGVNTTLWQRVTTSMTAIGTKTAVELHDNRSHTPGTQANPYKINDVNYWRCGGFIWRDALPDPLIVRPGSAPEVNVYKNNDEEFRCYDTRN